MWRRFAAEGAEWEVRAIPTSAAADAVADGAEQELLEFRSTDPNLPPRRLVVDAGALSGMDESRLHSALRQARPIGGDFYGRPGKRMGDIR